MSHEANEYDVEQAEEVGRHATAYDPHYLGGARKKEKKRGFSGCLAVLVALVVVIGGATVLGIKGFHYLQDHLQHSADYSGPGHGKVLFEVKKGESTSTIGRNLKNQNVVASVDAFLGAAGGHTGIQVGFYQLKKEMSADGAYKVLSNPKNIVTDTVTIPEGLRVADVVAILADKTKYSVDDFETAPRTPRRSGFRRSPRATRRATCSRRRTGSVRRRSPPTCSRTWSTAGTRPSRSTRSRPARRRWARRRPRS